MEPNTSGEGEEGGGREEGGNGKGWDAIEVFRRAVQQMSRKRNGQTYVFLDLTEGSPHLLDSHECFFDVGGLGTQSRIHALVEDANRGHLTRRRTKAGCFPASYISHSQDRVHKMED
jgi:hypothetical protein